MKLFPPGKILIRRRMRYRTLVAMQGSKAHLGIERPQEFIQGGLLRRPIAEEVNLESVGIYLAVFLPEEHAERNREMMALHECRMHQTAPEFKGGC